ncbi:MAG: peptide chain release factor N(5)-glutamine methyltransferase [Burkholderiaceae bacterium]|nr:peptide chain release factor N(5)-glutamine methyltransferase [Burkholderiaceae bacterium]
MKANVITICDALRTSSKQGLDTCDAETLLLHTLQAHHKGRAWLRAHSSDILEPEEAYAYNLACVRRRNGEPVAYITGRREFYGLNLMVDARVLDPRPDTETLVDWALEVLTGLHAPKVADLGTGSGAIALAIQHQRPDALVIATDASADALAVAETNAKRLNLPVRFALGPWLVPIATEPNSANHLQLIVSNPPYIADSDPHLTALHHEPRQALTSGSDGLDDIKHIVKNAPAHLRTGGWLLLEHGYDQASAVQDLLRAEGFDSIQTRQDLAGLDRCTGGSILKPLTNKRSQTFASSAHKG